MTLNLTVEPIMTGKKYFFSTRRCHALTLAFCRLYQVRSVDGWDESSSVGPADCHVSSGGCHVCADARAVRCRILPDGSNFQVMLRQLSVGSKAFACIILDAGR